MAAAARERLRRALLQSVLVVVFHLAAVSVSVARGRPALFFFFFLLLFIRSTEVVRSSTGRAANQEETERYSKPDRKRFSRKETFFVS